MGLVNDFLARPARAGPVQLLVIGTESISRRRTEIRRLAFLATHILQLLAGAPRLPVWNKRFVHGGGVAVGACMGDAAGEEAVDRCLRQHEMRGQALNYLGSMCRQASTC